MRKKATPQNAGKQRKANILLKLKGEYLSVTNKNTTFVPDYSATGSIKSSLSD